MSFEDDLRNFARRPDPLRDTYDWSTKSWDMGKSPLDRPSFEPRRSSHGPRKEEYEDLLSPENKPVFPTIDLDSLKAIRRIYWPFRNDLSKYQVLGYPSEDDK